MSGERSRRKGPLRALGCCGALAGFFFCLYRYCLVGWIMLLPGADTEACWESAAYWMGGSLVPLAVGSILLLDVVRDAWMARRGRQEIEVKEAVVPSSLWVLPVAVGLVIVILALTHLAQS